MKKGILFSVDALFAFIVIFAAFSLFTFLEVQTTHEDLLFKQIHFKSEDALSVLSLLKVSEANSSAINFMVSHGNITPDDMDLSVMELSLNLWASGDPENKAYASAIIEDVLKPYFSDQIKWQYLVNNETIYSSSELYTPTNLAISRRLASGFQKGAPLEGCSARLQLESLDSKNDSKYYFFGGFTGQGNISAVINSAPSDAVFKDIYLELNTLSQFNLKINGYSCGSFTPIPGNFSVTTWTITSVDCISKLKSGLQNVAEIVFTGSNSTYYYIGGGFIRLDYTTEQLKTYDNTSLLFYPGIEGVVNFYSSFYTPGNITSMNAYLHFYNNYTTKFYVGNKTIYSSAGSLSDQAVNLSNTQLSAILNYSSLSQTTVPIKTEVTLPTLWGGGNADVVLITDVSGSMASCINRSGSCSYPNRRIDLARQLDSEFVDIILNNSGNRVGLVTYSYNGYQARALTNNSASLKSTISGSSFNPSGSTCIGCGVRSAKMMLQSQSTPSKLKFIIVMSDGVANMRTYQPDVNRTTCCSTDSSYLCRLFGYCTCPLPQCGQSYYYACGDNVDDTARQNAVNDACYAHDATNATIHSIGFGPVAQCLFGNQTLSSIAECGHGEFYASDNADELRAIYSSLANQILIASASNQALNVLGYVKTTLYNDSYINFGYTSAVPQPDYKELTLNFQSNNIGGCDAPLFIPPQFEIIDIGLTSYSGDYWTDKLQIKNSGTGGVYKDVYLLSNFSQTYSSLGDPYFVKFPVLYLRANETNYFRLRLGLSSSNFSSSCSDYNKIIYTARLKSSTSFTGVLPNCTGLNTTIYYDTNYDSLPEGTTKILIGDPIPSVSRDISTLNITDNACDAALYSLLTSLNFVVNPSDIGYPGASTNPVDLNPEGILNFNSLSIADIPYLWGPAVVEVRSWLEG